MLATSVKLERTWRDRYLHQPAPRLVLDREQPYMAASVPLPQAYQSGLSAEYFVHLDHVVGRYPLGPMFPRYVRAFRMGIGADEHPDLDWTPPAKKAQPVLSIVNRARHTNYAVDVEDGSDEPIMPADEWRTYLLVVNNGGADAVIGFDKSALGGLLLASGGGFIELVTGTTSAVRAAGSGGNTTLTIVEGRAWPATLCRLPCEEIES